MKSLVAFSAGLDSTTMLYSLLKEKQPEDEIVLGFVSYGQLWNYERIVSQRFAKLLGLKLILLGSEDKLVLGTKMSVKERGYIPMRNPYILSVMVNHAVLEGFEKVYLGITAGCLYPDSTREFIERYEFMMQEALLEESLPKIEVPLINLTMDEIVEMSKTFYVPHHLTFSCYRQPREGDRAVCGSCPKCTDRYNTFRLAGYPHDPIGDLIADFDESHGFESIVSYQCVEDRHEDCVLIDCSCGHHGE